jgi:outer membrane lipoprotein carrier protein
VIRKSVTVLCGLVALVLIGGAGADRLHAQDMHSAIDKAVQKYGTMKTARGTLRLTNLTTLGATHHLAAEFQQQFPSLLSVRFTDPKGDMLVSDGKFTWFYQPSSFPGKVDKLPLGSVASVNLVGVFLDDPHKKYVMADSGKQTIDGHVTRAVGLVPRQSIPEFRRATVWIEEATGLIRQFEISEPSGMVRRVTFVTLQPNAPVDANQFKFTVPRGVKVVDGGR